jgi:hypothetical protein
VTPRWRLVGLALAGLGLAAALFFSCYERREVETPVARSREAIRNPYLALGRLLDRMGHEVVTVQGAGRLAELPPSHGTLVLTVSRRTLRGERTAELLEWVATGGHLIVASYSLWDDPLREEDPLLDPLGFRQFQHDLRPTPFDTDPPCDCPSTLAEVVTASETEAAEDEAEEEAPAASPSLRNDLLAALQPPTTWDDAEAWWSTREGPLAVQFDRRFYWGDTQGQATWAVAGAHGVHLLRTPHGRGTITALTDDLFLRNEHLGKADHGELAVRLARMGNAPGPVWIVVSEDWPGVFAALRRHAAPALASAALLLLAWLARAVRRFGPLRPGPAPERRRWIEHLEAVGRFHWRDDRGRVLLDGVRGSLLRELELQRPEWTALAPEERARRIARAAGLAPEQVAWALDPAAGANGEAAFVATVGDLERIRAAL